jgi:hypothetical protein
MIDAFFAPAKRPSDGPGPDQCIASAPIRNAAGAVVRWHALLTDEQWAYHQARGAKLFSADSGIAGKNGSPVHFFMGRPVIDPVAQKIYKPGKNPEDITQALPPPGSKK